MRFELLSFRKGSPSPRPVQAYEITPAQMAEVQRVLKNDRLQAPRWLAPDEALGGAAVLSIAIDVDEFAWCIVRQQH